MSDLFANVDDRGDPRQAGGWHYVRVAVERGLDQPGPGAGLTYRAREPLPVGRRVEVPLGRGGSISTGIVVRTGGPELADGFDLSRIKAVGHDTGTGLTEELVRLAEWMAHYYICPLGMVLAGMLPAAVKKRTGLRRVVLIDRADPVAEESLSDAKLTPAVAAAWAAVRELGREALPLEPHALAGKIGQRTLAGINRLVRAGLLREIEAEEVRQAGGVPTQMSIEQADPGGVGGPSRARPSLTNQQAKIVEGITGALGTFGVHLIRGVTGSGKTEVYLRVIEGVVRAGHAALVLVPEISLTPQIAGRFVERFAATGVAVLHSGLSASQRHGEWARAASGAARVVVGARSAVFAPLSRIGVVVVDEEHASDYKQDQLPRYHGRDVAIKRAQMCGGDGCPVILGSATPSLESWANAVGFKSSGGAESAPKYRLWELPERVGGGSLPRVDVVNLGEERRLRQGRGASKESAFLHNIGPTLEGAIGETLGEGGQVILLLNRRGYASYIACPDAGCGYAMACDECDAKMVQHRVVAGGHAPKGMVRCHHCGAQSLIPAACPVCGKRLIALGLGTQRAEEEIAWKFGRLLGAESGDFAGETGGASVLDPNAARRWVSPPGMLRVDGDTMGSARDYFDALSRFARGELRLLLGTQMISKGLDFPNVRLVGVINADTALGLPDFRAAERTFQLVSQVAGRAGRGSIPGRVIVQTLDPSQAPIRHAAAHDYAGFATEELECRRVAGLPPASRMARIVCRDTDLEKARGAAETIAAALRTEGERSRQNPPRISGPMPCAIARIGGFHRFSVEITAAGRSVIQSVLQAVRAKGLLKSDARTAVDVDPIALL